MLGQQFYHETIRKIIIAFGTTFNNIQFLFTTHTVHVSSFFKVGQIMEDILVFFFPKGKNFFIIQRITLKSLLAIQLGSSNIWQKIKIFLNKFIKENPSKSSIFQIWAKDSEKSSYPIILKFLSDVGIT